jgi:quercetin dioxygenase-like cupin family protein
MTLNLRRVVTGHDAKGRAIVTIDETLANATHPRAGLTASVIWSTAVSPADNTEALDGALRPIQTTSKGGSVFRIIEFAPGSAPRNHRTDSIDYAIVLSGEIDMEMDGSEVHLRVGDLLVQRGTIHNWINRGTAPCVIAFVLIEAKPVAVGGKVLNATG